MSIINTICPPVPEHVLTLMLIPENVKCWTTIRFINKHNLLCTLVGYLKHCCKEVDFENLCSKIINQKTKQNNFFILLFGTQNYNSIMAFPILLHFRDSFLLSKLSKHAYVCHLLCRYKLLAYIVKVHFVKGLLMHMAYSYIIKALLRHNRS